MKKLTIIALTSLSMSSVLFFGSSLALAQTANPTADSRDISGLQQKLGTMKARLAELQELAKIQEAEKNSSVLTADNLNALEKSLTELGKTLAIIKGQLQNNKLSDKAAVSSQLATLKSSLATLNEIVSQSNTNANALAESPASAKNGGETAGNAPANQSADNSVDVQSLSANNPLENPSEANQITVSNSNQASASLLSRIAKRKVIIPVVIVILIAAAAVIWYSKPKAEKKEVKKQIATA